VALAPETLELVRRIAIQHNGRHKPFDSFARETIQQITGEPSWQHQDPVGTVLSIIANPEPWQAQPLILIPFVPLREALGMGPKASHISYNDLVASRKLMRLLPPIVQKQEQDEKLSMLEQETMDAFGRFVSFSNLIEQRLELVPPPTAGRNGPALHADPPSADAAGGGMVPSRSTTDPAWRPILEAQESAWTEFIAAIRANRADAMDVAARQLSERLRAINPSAYPPPWRLQLEVWYHRIAPFHVARFLYWLAAIVLAVGLAKGGRAASLGMPLVWLAFAMHGVGIALRVILGGRPPVSNFYETTLWLPFVGVGLGIIFERVYRVQLFGLAASILAGIMLVLADYLPLDPSISPVVAVLRSNLWLTIHVLTIVASYGALALATVLAHLYGWFYLAGRGRQARLAALDLFLYRAIQVGVVLLACGIMLGAVWANASWGRYWGWDPKETWALITLLWFLALLHGRMAGWLKGVGVALCTVGGFLLLLMTYYGVSFYLVGLHSYAGGHAKPLPALLIGYLIAEGVFLALVGMAAFRRRIA
jgi:cytochrome c-type biogenesis protein CcsB